MPSSDDKVILVVTTFKEQNNLETNSNVSNIISSSEQQKTLAVTSQSTLINNLVVTNNTPSQLIIQPNQTLNIVATTQTASTILSAQSVGPALSGLQGIQGNIGPTGAAGISGYGYTGAQIIDGYLYISQVNPSGIVSSSYPIGYVLGSTGARGATGATGPVDLYVRTIEGLTGNVIIKEGTGILISNDGFSEISIGARLAALTKSLDPSAYGVAAFDSDDFVLKGGIVGIKTSNVKAQSGSFAASDTFSFRLRGATGQPITTQISGDNIFFNISSATSGACGIAYYDSSDFNVAGDGKVTLNGAVRSLSGCTGILGITGVSGEVEISYSCPTITIGLPNDVTINNLNILGTFSGILDGGSY